MTDYRNDIEHRYSCYGSYFLKSVLTGNKNIIQQIIDVKFIF